MKKLVCLAVLFAFLTVSGAYAEFPDLVGTWKGKADAILPDGTVLMGLSITADITSQTDGLFTGTFTMRIPGLGITVLSGTGYVSEDNMLKGIWSFQGVGIGFIEATVTITATRMVMEGVARDISDGSTTYIKVKKKV